MRLPSRRRRPGNVVVAAQGKRVGGVVPWLPPRGGHGWRKVAAAAQVATPRGRPAGHSPRRLGGTAQAAAEVGGHGRPLEGTCRPADAAMGRGRGASDARCRATRGMAVRPDPRRTAQQRRREQLPPPSPPQSPPSGGRRSPSSQTGALPPPAAPPLSLLPPAQYVLRLLHP